MAAQSLGDIARQNREAKQSAPKKRLVYDEDSLPGRIPIRLDVSNPPPYSTEQVKRGFERILDEAANIVEQELRGEQMLDDTDFVVALMEDENNMTSREWRAAVREYRDNREKQCRSTVPAKALQAKQPEMELRLKEMYQQHTTSLNMLESSPVPRSKRIVRGQGDPMVTKRGLDIWQMRWTNLQMMRDMELTDMGCDELLSHLK